MYMTFNRGQCFLSWESEPVNKSLDLGFPLLEAKRNVLTTEEEISCEGNQFFFSSQLRSYVLTWKQQDEQGSCSRHGIVKTGED